MNNKQKKSLYESIMKNVTKLLKYTLNESFKSNKIMEAFGNNANYFLALYAKYGISFVNVSDENIAYIPFAKSSKVTDDNIEYTLRNVISTLRKMYTNEELKKLMHSDNEYAKAFIENFKYILNKITKESNILNKCEGLGFLNNFNEQKNIYDFYKAYIYKELDSYHKYYVPLTKKTVSFLKLMDFYENCTGMVKEHSRLGNIFNSHLFRPVFPAINGIIVLNLDGVRELCPDAQKMINRDYSKKQSNEEKIIQNKQYWHNQYTKLVKEIKDADWDSLDINKNTGISKDEYKSKLTNIKKYLKNQ